MEGVEQRWSRREEEEEEEEESHGMHAREVNIMQNKKENTRCSVFIVARLLIQWRGRGAG